VGLSDAFMTLLPLVVSNRLCRSPSFAKEAKEQRKHTDMSGEELTNMSHRKELRDRVILYSYFYPLVIMIPL
jgi:hypothetical protein